jgi:hypothetical protein
VFDDVIHRLRIECAPRHVAPAIDGPEDAALVDLRCLQPGIQGIDRPAGEIDDLVVIGT